MEIFFLVMVIVVLEIYYVSLVRETFASETYSVSLEMVTVVLVICYVSLEMVISS